MQTATLTNPNAESVKPSAAKPKSPTGAVAKPSPKATETMLEIVIAMTDSQWSDRRVPGDILNNIGGSIQHIGQVDHVRSRIDSTRRAVVIVLTVADRNSANEKVKNVLKNYALDHCAVINEIAIVDSNPAEGREAIRRRFHMEAAKRRIKAGNAENELAKLVELRDKIEKERATALAMRRDDGLTPLAMELLGGAELKDLAGRFVSLEALDIQDAIVSRAVRIAQVNAANARAGAEPKTGFYVEVDFGDEPEGSRDTSFLEFCREIDSRIGFCSTRLGRGHVSGGKHFCEYVAGNDNGQAARARNELKYALSRSAWKDAAIMIEIDDC